MKSALLLLATLTLISCDGSKEPTQAEKVKARVEAQRKEAAEKGVRVSKDGVLALDLLIDEWDRVMAEKGDLNSYPPDRQYTYGEAFDAYETRGIQIWGDLIPLDISRGIMADAKIRWLSNEFQFEEIQRRATAYRELKKTEARSSTMPAERRIEVMAQAERRFKQDWINRSNQVLLEIGAREDQEKRLKTGLMDATPAEYAEYLAEASRRVPENLPEASKMARRRASAESAAKRGESPREELEYLNELDRIDLKTLPAEALLFEGGPTYSGQITEWETKGIDGVPREIAATIVTRSKTRWLANSSRCLDILSQADGYQRVTAFETDASNMPAAEKKAVLAKAEFETDRGWASRADFIDRHHQAWKRTRQWIEKGFPGLTQDETRTLVETTSARYLNDWEITVLKLENFEVDPPVRKAVPSPDRTKDMIKAITIEEHSIQLRIAENRLRQAEKDLTSANEELQSDPSQAGKMKQLGKSRDARERRYAALEQVFDHKSSADLRWMD